MSDERPVPNRSEATDRERSPSAELGERRGFVPFFRRYTRSWIHAVATAGLTAFGTLTIVHRGFVVLALASYLVPPLALYVGRRPTEDPADAERSAGRSIGRSGPETGASEREREAASRDGTGDDGTVTPDEAPTDRTATTDEAPADRTATTDEGATDDAPTAQPTAAEALTDEPPIRDDAASHDDAASGEAATDDDHAGEWTVVDSPTERSLLDVGIAGGHGAFAVGESGLVLARDADGWRPVLEDGPGADASDLHGVDATADGEAVWVTGDGGALGRIDAETGRHADYSAPLDLTDDLLGIAVGGSRGEEVVLAIDGSGQVLRGDADGDAVEWTEPVAPGGGSSLCGVAFAEPTTAYCCDTNDGVYETVDGGDAFERIGLEGADGTLVDLASAAPGECLVADDDGVVHRYDGPRWTPLSVCDGTPTSIDRSDGLTALSTEAGTLYERDERGGEWRRRGVDRVESLRSVAVDGTTGIAVGANGTIVER